MSRSVGQASIVRIDSSTTNHLVICTECTYTAGPYPTRREALTARFTHTEHHYRQREAARQATTRRHA